MTVITSPTLAPAQVGSTAPRVRAGHLLVLLLIVPAFVDVPALIGVGPLSGMGALTIVEAAIAAAAVLALRIYPHRVVLALAPYGGFLAWATVTTAWMPPSFGGTQNWIVYLLFALVTLMTGTVVAHNLDLAERAIEHGVRCMDAIALSIFAGCLCVDGLPVDGIVSVMGARSFALMGLLPMSWHVARWNSGYSRIGLFAWVWLVAIGLSLSRTATAIAVLYMGIALLLHLRLNARSLLLKAPMIAVATSAVVVVLTRSTPMAERLFSGDTSIHVGGVAVNASGRMNIWSTVIESAWTSPVVGQGLGSSMGIASTLDEIAHPHNDYLRVWHDLGFIGLTLFAIAFGWLFAVLMRKTTRTLNRTEPAGTICLAALLALSGVLIACATDNAIIYPFVMTPLGVLVGAGIGIRTDVDCPGSA
jgi:O-antigen ligase